MGSNDIYGAIETIPMTIEDFLTPDGRVSSTKTTEKYVIKHFEEDFYLIKKNSELINLVNVTFSEEIYHYLHSAESPIKCKNCGTGKPKFSGLLNGYLNYCSSKCSNSSNEVKELKKNSSIEKYGVDNPSKSKEVVGKIQNTFNLRYGGNPFSIFQDRIKQTNLHKYGTSYPLSKDSSLRESINKNLVVKFLEKYKDFEIINYEEIKGGTCEIKCKKCLNNFTISKWNLHQRICNSKIEIPCTICNPIGSSNETGIENSIKKILDVNNIIYEKKNRKILGGKEIDFYIPDKKIGIEVNGLFWHSERFKGKMYHSDKTKLASDKGIHLIHIFEDEIVNNLELVESRIKSILGLYEIKIFARNCRISEISREESKKFLVENHMQGNTGAKINLGLFVGDLLVSVMTFGDLRVSMGSKQKKDHWELIRFANKKNVVVVGGASKLLSYFIGKNKPQKIISYCDRRWSNGNFYEKIGFIKDGITNPNYWYVKNSRREGRFKFRKDKLIEEGYDKNKSESVIMSERGFLKIHDCGSFRFVMNLIP
jgi:very-short-patch-repair endonuclease